MLGKECLRPPPRKIGSHRMRLGGFTLIELLVAIAILAILTVAAAPSMTRLLARYRLTAAADEVITLMRYGQSEARMGKKGVILSISGNDLTVKDERDELRHIGISSRLIVNPSASLAGDSISFLANGQIRPTSKASGRLDASGKGVLLLCSPDLPDNSADPNLPQNAVAIRFSGAELSRKEHAGGAGCSVPPSP